MTYCGMVYARVRDEELECQGFAVAKCADCGTPLCRDCAKDCQDCHDTLCPNLCFYQHKEFKACRPSVLDYVRALVDRITERYAH